MIIRQKYESLPGGKEFVKEIISSSSLGFGEG